MGETAVAAAARRGLRERRHVRVPARARRRVLLPRDEHAAPGRASGDRAGLRRSIWCSGSSASPPASGCRLGHGRSPRAAGRSSAASRARIPPTGFCRRPGASTYLHVPAGPGVRWDGGIEAGRRGDPLLRFAARQAHRARPTTRRSDRADAARAARAGRSSAWRHRGVSPAPHGGRGVPARRRSTSSGSSGVPICLEPAARSRRATGGIAVAAALAEDERRHGRKPVGGAGERAQRSAGRAQARREALR